MALSLALIAALVLAGGLWLVWVLGYRPRGGARAWAAREHLPAELRRARLWASERTFSVARPIPLVGRPDQVYERDDGALVVVDTKTRRRARIYDRDRVQLSVYAALLSWRGHRVASHGYLRFPGPPVRYRRLRLWSPERVVRLYRRYRAVVEGEVAPRVTPYRGLCRRCAHRERCWGR